MTCIYRAKSARAAARAAQALLCASAILFFMTAGCAKHYVVTARLNAPLPVPAPVTMGNIVDGLPTDMDVSKKPTVDEVRKLKRFVEEELARKGLARVLPAGDSTAAYEVAGTFLEFARGSGAARFIGFGLGKANATVQLKLLHRSTNTTLYAGNFSGQVSDWTEKGDQMFLRIAQDFSKELAKELKAVAPGTKLVEQKKDLGYSPMP